MDPIARQSPGTASTPLTPRCNAPFTSLYLDPAGEVRACCQNEWMRLGNVSEQRLPDIWNGPELARLRAAVAAGDLGLGCELCVLAHDRGAPEAAFLHVFDRLAPEPSPPYPQRLELAISNACNLQCTMCNGDLSSAIRIHRERRPAARDPYDATFFADLDAFLPHLREVVFLGGEPLLAAPSLRIMERLVDRGLDPMCHITTNGTQWNARIERLLRSLPVHVAVSVDGATDATFEAIRVGARRAEVLANIDRYREAAGQGDAVSIAFSLQRDNWRELGAVLRWAESQQLSVYVNEVVHPSWASLLHAPTDELTRILAALEEEEPAVLDAVDRLRFVWTAQVNQIRGELTSRGASQAPGEPSDLAERRLDLARSIVAHPTAEVVEIDVGRSGTVVSIRPDASSVFGVDLRGQIGDSLIHAVRPLVAERGTLAESTLHHLRDGVELRTLVHRSGAGARVLEMAMAPDQPWGETWVLSSWTERGAPDPLSGGTVGSGHGD